MKVTKFLALLGIAVLVSVLAVSGVVYARAAGTSDTRQSDGEVGKIDTKGAVYHAIYDVGRSDKDVGDTITIEEMGQLRDKNPETGLGWSDSTLRREAKSLVLLGIFEETGDPNTFKVAAKLTYGQLKKAQVSAESVITTKEKGTGRPLGLRRYSIDDLNKNDKQKQQLTALQGIVSGVMNPLNKVAVKRVKTVTADAIMNQDVTEGEILGYVNQDYKVAIVSSSRDDVNNGIIKRLLANENIVFSLLPETIFNEIKRVLGNKVGNLNMLNKDLIDAIKERV